MSIDKYYYYALYRFSLRIPFIAWSDTFALFLILISYWAYFVSILIAIKILDFGNYYDGENSISWIMIIILFFVVFRYWALGSFEKTETFFKTNTLTKYHKVFSAVFFLMGIGLAILLVYFHDLKFRN